MGYITTEMLHEVDDNTLEVNVEALPGRRNRGFTSSYWWNCTLDNSVSPREYYRIPRSSHIQPRKLHGTVCLKVSPFPPSWILLSLSLSNNSGVSINIYYHILSTTSLGILSLEKFPPPNNSGVSINIYHHILSTTSPSILGREIASSSK